MFTNPILSKNKNIFIYVCIWVFISAVYIFILNVELKINIQIAAFDLLCILLLFGIGIFLWYPASFLTPENYKPFKIFLHGQF